MKPVIQLETTGCGIASCAAIAGIPYAEAKSVANELGIAAYNITLWLYLLRYGGRLALPTELGTFSPFDHHASVAVRSVGI